MSQSAFIHSQPHPALLRVSGEDAADYLQSQFSNDLSSMGLGSVVYGFWLNRKGTVRADSFICLRKNDYWISSYFVDAETLEQVVTANIIADAVDVVNVSTAYAHLSLWGSGVEVLLAALGLQCPQKGRLTELDGHSGFAMCGRHAATANYDFFLTTEAAQSIRARACANGAVEADWNLLQRARIQAGIAAVPFDLGEGDLPQEAGAEIDGVSFNKGCYLGQETMARLHAMGSVRRSLYRVCGVGRVPGVPFSLFAAGKQAGQVRCAATSDDHWYALAILTNRRITGHTELDLGTGGDQRISCQPLATRT